MVLRSLKTKILLSVIIAVVVIEGLFLYLNIRSLSRQMIEKTEEEVFSLSETIRLSIRNAMIKDRRDEYQRIIDDVAQRKGIVEVRIFNKLGEITVSSDRAKVGTVVDKQAEACFGCHRQDEAKVLLPSDSKTRIYEKGDQSLLGLINPIYNEPSCYPCHPKTLNVLGVLDTTISLEEFEKQKAQVYSQMITTGAHQCSPAQFSAEPSGDPFCQSAHRSTPRCDQDRLRTEIWIRPSPFGPMMNWGNFPNPSIT